MVISLFYPFVGGAEKVCQILSKRLIEEGFSVTVLTQHCNGLSDYEEIEGIPVYRKMKGWHLFELTYMLSVLCFLLKHRKKFDVIQCFGLYLFTPPALLIKYLFGKRVVSRVLCSGQFGDLWRIKQLQWKKLVIASSKRLDRIIFISNDIKKELIENQFPIEKLVYISNGVNVDRFKPPEGDEHRSAKNVCFVGRLEKQKGVEYLLEAIDIVRTKENDVRLFVVGDGQLKTTLEYLCKKLKLEDHVVFVGFTHDVLPYYKNAQIFVLPSISEGMPLSLLEAMSCGLPVVATRVGGNTEILDSNLGTGEAIVSDYHIGENGILVNAGDAKGLAEALLKILKDEGLSKRLGGKAREIIEKKFSQEKVLQGYINLYYSLL